MADSAKFLQAVKDGYTFKGESDVNGFDCTVVKVFSGTFYDIDILEQTLILLPNLTHLSLVLYIDEVSNDDNFQRTISFIASLLPEKLSLFNSEILVLIFKSLS